MAERVLQHTATIPAGTPADAPVTSAADFDNWQIERIALEVPAGPLGCLGFYLANNGVPWIPRTPGEWLVWDDRVEHFTPDGYPTASGWAIVGYNLGTFDHVVVCRFEVNPPAAPGQAFTWPSLVFTETDVKQPPAVIL